MKSRVGFLAPVQQSHVQTHCRTVGVIPENKLKFTEIGDMDHTLREIKH